MRILVGGLAAAIIAVLSMPVTVFAQAGPPQDRYIVVLNPGWGPPANVAADVAGQSNGRVGFVYRNALQGFSITMPRAAVAGVARDPRVAYVEEDIPVTVFAQTVPTGVQRIFADPVALDIDGIDDFRVDVDIAVLDTGIDREHPDLYVVGGADCLESSGGPPWAQTNFCDDTKSADDDHYHGTHVAGTVAALDNDFGVVGVAPGARLWAVKVLDQQGSGSLSGIIAGIDWVVAQGVIEIINMSLGGSGSSNAMNDAVANAVTNGVTVVVAAGNSDDDAANYTPANAPDAVTVSALADFDGAPGGLGAATCRSDQDDTLADFSNWGAVDIAAPGVCILSTMPIEQGEYGTLSGTSMASPHAAGAAGLLASVGYDPLTIRATLLDSGNYDWLDDSGDGTQEPLLDISSPVFQPALVASDGGSDGNVAPVASFGYGCEGLSCSFVDQSSDDDGTISAWLWDFGDGASSNEQSPSHTYATDGTYPVTLTVTDNDGASDDASQSVSVASDNSGSADACDALSDGVHLAASSSSEGRTWTAIVDAVNCVSGDVANFESVTLSWSPLVGAASDDCSTSTGICQATQSGIRKNTGSVDFSLNGASITVPKP